MAISDVVPRYYIIVGNGKLECAEHTNIETGGDKFIIGHETSQECPSSECVIGREALTDAPHWRTLSRAMDFDHQRFQ
jgi:hypothetical protein